jgi:hypothetical protein
MLKSRSSRNVFARIPSFRKRYPRGSFWSGYEHHESIGRDMEQAAAYIISGASQNIMDSPHPGSRKASSTSPKASGDTACSGQF